MEFAEEHDLSVLIKDIQYDSVYKEIFDLDFQKVNPQQRVQVEVPIWIKGIDAIQRVGNVVIHQTNSIKVECLPNDIPRFVEADISGLKPGCELQLPLVELIKGLSVMGRVKAKEVYRNKVFVSHHNTDIW